MTPEPRPKPGPSLTDPQTAGFLAREAKRRAQMLADPLQTQTFTADDREVLAAETTALALTSLALTQLNPPARRRPAGHQTRPASAVGRVLDANTRRQFSEDDYVTGGGR